VGSVALAEVFGVDHGSTVTQPWSPAHRPVVDTVIDERRYPGPPTSTFVGWR
jgi:hypothetical protein